MAATHSKTRSFVTYSPKPCAFCGVTFTPVTSKPTTCSWQCRFLLLQAEFKPSDACWRWPLSFNPQTGYGQFHTEGEARRNQAAHRLSYLVNKGDIPDTMQVMHSCDNRWCFNPAHLSLGTHAENLADMRQKGRGALPPRAAGDAHPNAKLTSVSAREIRASSETVAVLAARYGVSKSAIGMVRAGATWKESAPLQSSGESPPRASNRPTTPTKNLPPA